MYIKAYRPNTQKNNAIYLVYFNKHLFYLYGQIPVTGNVQINISGTVYMWH